MVTYPLIPLLDGDELDPAWISDVTTALNDHQTRLTQAEADIDAFLSVAVKSADETVNNNATTQPDDHLFLSVVANTTYFLDMEFLQSSGTIPDLRGVFTFPSGLTMLLQGLDGTLPFTASESTIFNYAGTGANAYAKIWGRVTVGSTSGTLAWTWAQFTANASNTIIRAGGYMRLMKSS